MALRFASQCVSMTSCLKVVVLETGLPYLEIPNGIFALVSKKLWEVVLKPTVV